MNYANIIVLSTSYKIKMAIRDKLKQEPSFTVDIQTGDIKGAQARFTKNMMNVLIVDTDSINVEPSALRLLAEKYAVHIITTGKHLMLGGNAPFVMKPAVETPDNLAATAILILQKVRSAVNSAPAYTLRDAHNFVEARQKIIAVGSSTGGTEALPVVLSNLPIAIAPVLIVQHMPSMFTKQLADRIDKMSAITVKEAQNGEFIRKGTAYIAPGDLHMRLVVRQQRLALECFFADKVNGVRPAADILFESVARISGSNAIGVIMTGMGADGARGLVEMHKKSARVIGQTKESCVVYGMPKAAKDLGAVDMEVPLQGIAKKLVELSG